MLHFTTRAEWDAARATGEYAPLAMASEGFIHLSYGHQVAAVASMLVPGAADLVLLVVDPSPFAPGDVRVEGGFPHLYRRIPASAVRLVVDFPPEADGSFRVPEEARWAELALLAAPSAAEALDRAATLMAGFAGPWWLGGGWAVDASTGRVSRPHLDLDVVVLRRDTPGLGPVLAGCDVRVPHDGTLTDWPGGDLAPADHQLWARPDDGSRPPRWQDFALDPGFFELLVEEVDGDGTWVYRRHPAVRAELERLGRPGGFLSPEVALLYKAKAAVGGDAVTVAKTSSDFGHCLPHLDGDQRRWLQAALRSANPGHPWIELLDA